MNLTTVVFDKTGTLTRGEFRVVDIATDGSLRADEVLRIVAAVEHDSEHTIAHGIVKPSTLAQSGDRAPSGYTRFVGWRHRIALVLLLALTGLPVGGTLCAIACDSASTQTASHHGKDPKCEEPAAPSSGPQLSDRSAHDCTTHDAAMLQVATTAAERADLSAKSVPSIIGSPSLGELVVLHEAKSAFDYTVPPGTAPPTARPLVLRV